jgi:hypothetical protein
MASLYIHNCHDYISIDFPFTVEKAARNIMGTEEAKLNLQKKNLLTSPKNKKCLVLPQTLLQD